MIEQDRIVSPTARNQPAIEEDPRTHAGRWLGLGVDERTAACERAIRDRLPLMPGPLPVRRPRPAVSESR